VTTATTDAAAQRESDCCVDVEDGLSNVTQEEREEHRSREREKWSQ
jgi:hypothetical protein